MKVLDVVARGVVVIPWLLVAFAVVMILGLPLWLGFAEGGRAWVLSGVIYGSIAFACVYGWADDRLRKRPQS